MQFPSLPPDGPSKAPISYHFEDVSFPLLAEEKLTTWLLETAKEEGKPFDEVNFIFCSDEYLREMNVEYLNHDYYTDVITFPYAPGEVAGDVFISSERVADNAQINGVDFDRELCRVMVHGILHLCGYKDKTPEEEAQMREKENHYLEKLWP